MSQPIVVLSSDLMVVSAAEGIARRHGKTITSVSDTAAIVRVAIDQNASLVALDLRTPGLDSATMVMQLRKSAPAAAIVAFGPHVHEQSLATAKAAGCDEVFTRGQFERRFEQLLSEL